ncbi:ribosomal protein L32E [Bradyrhizobium embrapense]
MTDPDSRAMAAHTKVGVGYNIQIAVDAKNKMIVEQAVSNDVLDIGLLQRTAEPARAMLDVEKINIVADKGYYKIEDIEACERAALTPYVPRPQRGAAVKNGFFRKDEFRYDTVNDVYICPAGKTLKRLRESRLRELKKIEYGNPKACRACSLRSRCTKNIRHISRLDNEGVLDRMAERVSEKPEILNQRREIVEHPFRYDQTVDEPGRIPYARARKRAHRVQPNGARLQSPKSAQHPWHQSSAGGRASVKLER